MKSITIIVSEDLAEEVDNLLASITGKSIKKFGEPNYEYEARCFSEKQLENFDKFRDAYADTN